jgi:hypothetical protein
LQTCMTYVSIESYTALAKEAETIIIMCCLFKSGDSLLRCSQGYASRRSRDCIGYRSDDLECDKYDNIRNQDYLYTSTGVRMNETKAEFSLRSTWRLPIVFTFGPSSWWPYHHEVHLMYCSDVLPLSAQHRVGRLFDCGTVHLMAWPTFSRVMGKVAWLISYNPVEWCDVE